MKPAVALCYAHALGEGGYPRDIRWLASALHRRGVRVVLATAGGEQTREGLDHQIPLWDLSELASRHDELSCAHFFGIFIPVQLKSMAEVQKCGLPVILSPWAQLFPHALKKSRWRKKLYLMRHRRTLRRVDGWSVFSESEWETVRNCFGQVRGKRVFGGLGHYPHDSGKVRDKQRSAAGRPFTILFFGRCDVWQKGIDVLIDAYALLRKTCSLHGLALPHLTIAGRPWRDSEERIQRHIDRLDLHADAIERLEDVPEKEIPNLLSRADLFVYLSRFDGPPRPLRMAVESGVFVLASLEAGMAEELALTSAGSSTSLEPHLIASRMFELMCFQRSLSPKSRLESSAALGWTWDVVAEKMEGSYKQLLSRASEL